MRVSISSTPSDRRLLAQRAPKPPASPYPKLSEPCTHPAQMAGRERELGNLRQVLAQSVPILGLYAPAGMGKSSLLAAGLVPEMRQEGRSIAFDRHPWEPGIARRLLGDLLEAAAYTDGDDLDPHAFVDRLRAFPEPPVLVLDQFENLFSRADAERTRAAVGMLLAASVQRRVGLQKLPCQWLLAYRQEFHGEVFQWLGDVLRDARQEAEITEPLHDLLSADRFLQLSPLGTPPLGAGDFVDAATKIFRAAIERPLQLTSDGAPLYRWRFTDGSAQRLARAFGEARANQRHAPLGPELHVVLAHLLDTSGKRDEDGMLTVDVPEDPDELIDRALEEHLVRSLHDAFPSSLKASGDVRIRRTRALLALRELAEAQGRRGESRQVTDLAQPVGRYGQGVLEKLETPRTRLVLLERHGEDQVYVLSNDRMAKMILNLVEDGGAYADLGVDSELLSLRRFVALQRQLYTSGEVGQSTEVPKQEFSGIERHADALLWDEEERRWWDACRERRRLDRRKNFVRGGGVLAALMLLILLGMTWIGRYFHRQELLETIADGEPEAAFGALSELVNTSDATLSESDFTELRARLEQRDVPTDVLEWGLDGLDETDRSEAVLKAVRIALPWVKETPEDRVLIANLVCALDVAPGRDPSFIEESRALRDLVLEPLRRRHPPPPPSILERADWPCIRGDRFPMGTPPGEELGDDDERPQHEVTVSDFRMQRHEVTNAEYRRLVPNHYGDADDLPAAFITWYAAYTYAAWLGGRLPTEAEWEYAARAGCQYAYCDREGRETEVDRVAWMNLNSFDEDADEFAPRPVRQLEPNPWGLHDMLGNLWEWTVDEYGPYPDGPQSDPWGLEVSDAETDRADSSGSREGASDRSTVRGTSGRRVSRGGSFWNTADWVRVASRDWNAPDDKEEHQGLRVVLPGCPEP